MAVREEFAKRVGTVSFISGLALCMENNDVLGSLSNDRQTSKNPGKVRSWGV